MKSMKKHNAFMASIPSKRNDPYAAAAAEVDNPGFLLTTVEKLAGLAQARSMWPVTMGLACCAIEMMAAGTPRFDMARFGWEVFRASPRHADVMIVSGRVSHKMAPIVRNVYDSMPEPKWVISMGACASSGGIFNNYAVVQGCDHIVPGGHLPARLPAPPRDAPQRHARAHPPDREEAAVQAPRGDRPRRRGRRPVRHPHP